MYHRALITIRSLATIWTAAMYFFFIIHFGVWVTSKAMIGNLPVSLCYEGTNND